jgi:hypothetical protein
MDPPPDAGVQVGGGGHSTLAGGELMPMLKKGQLVAEEGARGLTPAEQFYALAA